MNVHAVFTIVSNNYLHFARTMLQSVRATHPQSDIYCVIVDRDTTLSTVLANEFDVISLNQLNLPGGEQFLFQYEILELNTAVKPWVMEWLLTSGYQTVTYIDPDIFVYRPLDEVTQLLNTCADIVITPHLLAPIDDNKKPNELDIRRVGTYNFGFCAIRESDNTRAFLKWWQRKLERNCIIDLDHGIFVDQSWIDLVPGLFQNVAILRHPGYNVAYWNLAQREVKMTPGEGWFVNDQPLVFFHFSGLDPIEPQSFSKHQNRFTLSNLGAVKNLTIEYADRLIKNGAQNYIKQPYGYGRFSDNSLLPNLFRKLYREDEQLRQQMGAQPFDHPEQQWAPVGKSSRRNHLILTYAMAALWNVRLDLQTIFPLGSQASIADFYRWFVAQGDAYYSPIVIDRHKAIISQWDRQQTPSKNNSSRTVQSRGLALGAERTQALFWHLLERLPEPAALRQYAAQCQTTLGYARSWISIALSSESRAKAGLLSRLFGAVRSRSMFSYSGNPLPANTSYNNHNITYSGIFLTDPDFNTAGFWVSEEVLIPFSISTGDRVLLCGSYFPDLIDKQTQNPVSVLQFWKGSEIIHECELTAEGDFEISFTTLPDNQVHSNELLRIVSDKAFIPIDIGIKNDDRKLAWRLRKLVIGDLEIIDCKRPAAFLSPVEYLPAPGVNLVGYITAEMGVGEGVRAFAKAAVAANIPYSVIDVGYQSQHLQRDKSALQFAVQESFDIDIVYVNADQTPRTLEFLRRQNHNSWVKVGFWHWEQPQLPKCFLSSFEGLSEIWVPSAFVQDAVAKISPLPVFKVPHVIEFKITPGVSRADFDLPEGVFIVLVMYDFDSYQYRKNPEASIAAFRLAAAKRSDALLLIKTINAEKYPEKYATLKKNVADLNNVIFLDRFLTRQQVFDLEYCCDCMISLHRAEGFGLGPAEMMYLGKPVIATGWSANMEFMTPMNSFPVNYELKILEEQIGVYEAGQEWAEADIEHAAVCLQRLLDETGLALEIGQHAAKSIRKQLSSTEIGRQYRERLVLIAKRHGL